METIERNETLVSFADNLGIAVDQLSAGIKYVAAAEHKYIKDLKINVANVLASVNLNRKECSLLALAVAINEKNSVLIQSFTDLAKKHSVTDLEFAEVYSCVSLLNVNNVFYRFRHFTKKDYYETTPAGIKMSIMMNPVLGKELFELMSLAVSSLNGCEMCVNAHEESLIKLGSSQARIFDAIRIASVIKGLCILG